MILNVTYQNTYYFSQHFDELKKTGNKFEVKGEPTWFWREIFTPAYYLDANAKTAIITIIRHCTKTALLKPHKCNNVGFSASAKLLVMVLLLHFENRWQRQLSFGSRARRKRSPMKSSSHSRFWRVVFFESVIRNLPPISNVLWQEYF